MNKAFKTFFKFDEDAEINSASNCAFHFITNSVFLNNFLFLFFALTFIRENQFSFLRKCSDYGNANARTHKFFQFFKYAIFIAIRNSRIMFRLQLRCWKKSLQTLPFKYESTAVCLFDQKFKHALLFNSLFSFTPDKCGARFFERQLNIAINILIADDFCSDNIADIDLFDQIARIDVFAAVNNTSSKWRQVDIHGCTRASKDLSFNDISY